MKWMSREKGIQVQWRGIEVDQVEHIDACQLLDKPRLAQARRVTGERQSTGLGCSLL